MFFFLSLNFRPDRRLSVLDEVSEDSTSSTPAKDGETESSSGNDGSIAEDQFVGTCKIIIEAPSIKIRKLEKQPKISEPKLLRVENSEEGGRNNSRSFESYLDRERKTSLPRQASDPLAQGNRLHVCTGSLSPSLGRQTSRSRPLQVSCSSISSSSQDLESDVDHTQTESDEHSITLVNDSPQFSSSSSAIPPLPPTDSPPPFVNSSPSDDSSSHSFPCISISEASPFLSFEDISSSIYESFRSSFEESAPSSPTYLTATPTFSKLPSPFNSPQCSFHSCCSSPIYSLSPLSGSNLSLSPIHNWRRMSLTTSQAASRLLTTAL